MSYKKAADVLPQRLIDEIQSYVDGEYLYIPRKEENRRPWGDKTMKKQETVCRNREIYREYSKGMTVPELSEKYYLCEKSIWKIIAGCRRESL